MRTLVHLSDLHFGRVDPAVLEPLRKAIDRLRPHVVVVSGDLTQRARPQQFREARAYLDTLPRPQILVPGNHDVPLYNIVRRFVNPLANYRRYIGSDLEPTLIDEEIAIVGVNTARSLVFKGGRINEEQVERVRAKLCALDECIVKLVVTHHPFDMPENWDEGQIVGRAKMAMEMFSRCGADILLAGHVHMSHTGETAPRYRIPGYSALVVQAGTATSTRGRGEANSFNALHIDGNEVRVDRHAWDVDSAQFALVRSDAFARESDRWNRI